MRACWFTALAGCSACTVYTAYSYTQLVVLCCVFAEEGTPQPRAGSATG